MISQAVCTECRKSVFIINRTGRLAGENSDDCNCEQNKQFIHERDTYVSLLKNEYKQLDEAIKEIESVSNKIEKKKFVLI